MPSPGFLIFVLFNHYYRDGNHRKDIAPRSTTIIALMIYEACILLILDGIILRVTNFSFVDAIAFERTSRGIGQLNAAIIGLLLYPANHLHFVRNKGFDKLYEEYHNSAINTKKNRIICAVIWILGVIGLLILAIIIKPLLQA